MQIEICGKENNVSVGVHNIALVWFFGNTSCKNIISTKI